MNTRTGRVTWIFAMAVVVIGMVVTGAFAGQGKVTHQGNVTIYTQPEYEQDSVIDYENALPMPMPTAENQPPGPYEEMFSVIRAGAPGFEPGNPGSGKAPKGSSVAPGEGGAGGEACLDNEVVPQEYGTANHPYTTTRVDVSANNPTKYYPFRAAGKLYFKIGSSSYICSASLIKRGLIVTAAHCVANFGKKQYYSNWQYVPAMYDATKPYGTWNVTKAYVLTSYYNGTDSCAQAGVICANDVAVLVVTPQTNAYPGTTTGWFGYGYNGYGYAPNNLALINQLGYPASHDGGTKMQRTDSQGYVSTQYSGNTIWGSRQTGGSSGGPELVNLGILPVLSGGIAVGSEAATNTVVGVTSWGFTTTTIKQQGASPFTSNNIVALKNTACAAYPAACN